MWFTVCRCPQSQESDWVRFHLCKLARHGPWPVAIAVILYYFTLILYFCCFHVFSFSMCSIITLLCQCHGLPRQYAFGLFIHLCIPACMLAQRRHSPPSGGILRPACHRLILTASLVELVCSLCMFCAEFHVMLWCCVQSFRFGPEISAIAAFCLEVLKYETRKILVGSGMPGQYCVCAVKFVLLSCMHCGNPGPDSQNTLRFIIRL